MGRNKYNKEKTKKISNDDELTQFTFMYYYNWLKLITLNLFKWENLPETVDKRYLELTLGGRGLGLFFQDSELGHLTLPVNLSGRFNVYGIPVDYYAYSSANGYQNRNVNSKNSVLIWNNYLKQNNQLLIQVYAQKLTNIERAIDINVNGQKTPIIISSTEQQKLTVRNMADQYDSFQRYIWVDSSMDEKPMQMLLPQSVYTSDKLEVLKHNIINDFLSFFGVEVMNSDKKERMIADEVNSNYGLVEIDRNIYLRPREEAVEKINKMFNLDIKVSFNSEIATMVNEPNTSISEVNAEDGEI